MISGAPRVIMFDLDGTLVDTMFAFADLAAALMAERHGDEPAWARRRYLETSGVPFAHQLEIIHPGHVANGSTAAEFEERKRAITRRADLDRRTVAALEALRDLGIKLVLSSNTGQEFVDELIERKSFEFDLALGFDAATGMAKGLPHVRRTLNRFGVPAGDVWFVGDSLKDFDLARANGLAFFGRVGTFAAGDFERRAPGTPTISHIDELLGVIALPMVARSAVG